MPASGSSFRLGGTGVNCTAIDGSARTATCTFSVTLVGNTIAATKFEAFGDSLTAGETGRPSIFATFNSIDVPNAYPTKLQESLDATYPGQGVQVINRGHSLDTADQTDALARSFAARDRPDAILVLTGYNNLTQACGASETVTPVCRDAIRDVGNGVRSCVRHAREVDATLAFVFVSTLTPPGATGSNRISFPAIVQANDQIRQVAVTERAVLVDSFAAFVGHESAYVNADGLHLTPAGYKALADGFFAAIQASVPQTPRIQ